MAQTADLISKVTAKEFGEEVLRYLANAARIKGFGTFYIPDLTRPKPVLSIWSGRISDYWYRHNAKTLLSNRIIRDQIVECVRSTPLGEFHLERWHPGENDPRKAMYDRAELIERVAVYSQDIRSGFQSFYLRGIRSGWLSSKEYKDLQELLPIVHGLIGLRHRIVGSESFQFTPGTGASSLRERNVTRFAALSAREVEVCDCLVEGQTAVGTAIELGISEATVRTLRQRAYRKLGVRSVTQLMALIMNDMPN